MEIKNGGISENKIDKYIYQIICQNGTFEIGIFCRILDTSNHELAIALMTNRNVNITNKSNTNINGYAPDKYNVDMESHDDI